MSCDDKKKHKDCEDYCSKDYKDCKPDDCKFMYNMPCMMKPIIMCHYHYFMRPRPYFMKPCPTTYPYPMPMPMPNCRWYTVRRGDTMYSIAQQNNIPLNVLINANPQIPNPDLIYPGQKICIPMLMGVEQPEQLPMMPPIQQQPITLPYTPPIGMPIMPPMMPPTGAPVMPPTQQPTMPPMTPPTGAPVMPPTQQPTMPPMTPPTGAPVMPPIQQPTMPPMTPPTGAPVMPPTQQPTMPPMMPPTMPTPVAPIIESPMAGCTWYTVKKGDTMYKIAQKNNISLNALIAANPQIQNPALIFPGQEICIPTGGGGGGTGTGGCTWYTVKKGDTMYKIAQSNNISLNALIAANPQIQNPALIHPGQKVCIPMGSGGSSGSTNNSGCMWYTVKKGDTMYKIAQKHNISLDTLVTANPQIENPELIRPGQKICIPNM